MRVNSNLYPGLRRGSRPFPNPPSRLPRRYSSLRSSAPPASLRYPLSSHLTPNSRQPLRAPFLFMHLRIAHFVTSLFSNLYKMMGGVPPSPFRTCNVPTRKRSSAILSFQPLTNAQFATALFSKQCKLPGGVPPSPTQTHPLVLYALGTLRSRILVASLPPYFVTSSLPSAYNPPPAHSRRC